MVGIREELHTKILSPCVLQLSRQKACRVAFCRGLLHFGSESSVWCLKIWRRKRTKF